jgi:hypothetical protein
MTTLSLELTPHGTIGCRRPNARDFSAFEDIPPVAGFWVEFFIKIIMPN